MSPALSYFLAALATEGRAHDAHENEHARKRLNLEPATADLVSLLVQLSGARRVLEIGTSNGYSTLVLADAVGPRGHVTSVERDATKQAEAAENLRRAGLDERVTLVCGEATEEVRNLSGGFDAVFFDADRWTAPAQLRLLLPSLPPKALLLADNVLSHPDEIAGYLETVRTLPECFHQVLPVGKGLSVAVYRP